MPPKKKKGKKGGRKKTSPIVDGLSPNEMSPAQLLGHIKRLQTEIDREREERNFFMLEREKLFTLWNLAVEQLSEEKQKARLIDVQMEQNKKEAKSEMDLYKQKLRFLQAEQSKKLGLVRLNHLEKMRRVQDEVWAIQMMLKESLSAKKKQLRNAQVSLFELMRRMHTEHADKTSAMRKQFAFEIRRIEMEMDRQLERDRENMEHGAKTEMAKLIQIKEDQLSNMMQRHEKQVLEMKTFFNDLAVNNFAVITSLQQDIANKKVEEQRSRRELKESKDKYFGLLGPIKQMESQMEEWSKDELNLKAIHDELKRVNAQVESNKRYTRMIECANEALSQRIGLMKEENDGFKKAFVKELLDVQKKASMQRLVLEMKIKALRDEADCMAEMMDAKKKGVGVYTGGAGKTYEGEEDGEGDGHDENRAAPASPQWHAAMSQFCKQQVESIENIKESRQETQEQVRNIMSSYQQVTGKAVAPYEGIGYPLRVPGAHLPSRGPSHACQSQTGAGGQEPGECAGMDGGSRATDVKKMLPRSWSSKSSRESKMSATSVSLRSTKSAKLY